MRIGLKSQNANWRPRLLADSELRAMLWAWLSRSTQGGASAIPRANGTPAMLDRHGLVTWKGRTPVLRMLQVPELKRAMGFNGSYAPPHGSRRDRIKVLGNGVEL
jgi:hypothetical protein